MLSVVPEASPRRATRAAEPVAEPVADPFTGDCSAIPEAIPEALVAAVEEASVGALQASEVSPEEAAEVASPVIGVDPPSVPTMRILGHSADSEGSESEDISGGGSRGGRSGRGSGAKALQFEVRWEFEGEEPEDFWFDRGELLAHHRDALLAYEAEHGL